MSNKYLIHHGVKGMHWGIRRYQNYDGTLKHPKGRKGSTNSSNQSEPEKQKKKGLTDKQKRAIKIGAAVAGAALLTYGVYKVSKSGAFKSPDGKMINVDFANKSPIENMNFDYNKGEFILGDDRLKTEIVNGVERIKDFNPNFNPKASNCRQANSEFLCKKMGIDCYAKPAEIINGVVQTGLDPKKMFPQAKSDTFEIVDHIGSEKEFNDYLSQKMKNVCGGKDGFGGITIKLRKGMKHQLSWEVVGGEFRIINTNGDLNTSYYSTFVNNIKTGLFQAGNIEYFKAEGPIDMAEVAKQVILK